MWFPIRKILPKNAKSILLNKIHLENSTASLFKLGVLSIETRNKIEIIKKLLKDNEEVSIQCLDYNSSLLNNLNQLDGLLICYDMDNTSNHHIIHQIKDTIDYSYLLIGFKSNSIISIHDHITTSKHIQLLKDQLYSSLNTNNEGIVDIIDQILNTTQDEYHHITIFLTVFRRFMKPLDLLTILITKFEFDLINQGEKYQSKRSSAKFIIPTLRQERISYFFDVWLSHYWDDFNESVIFRSLMEFTKRISIYAELSSIHNTIALKTQKRKKDSGFSESFIIQSQGCFPDLLQVTPGSLAQQLTFIDMELFNRVQAHDFLDKENAKNPLSSIIDHFNYLSGWIATVIIIQEQFEKRVETFEYCIQLAIELSRLNNFNGLMAVLGGINSAAILRLRHTRFHIQCHSPTLYQQFLDLENLMSSERSFYNYRSKLNKLDQGIPYFGIHQQDLLSLNEANKDYLVNGKIHWRKFELIGDCISKVMKFQSSCSSDISVKPLILGVIGQKSTLLTEDERYQRSIEIEPRLANPILLF